MRHVTLNLHSPCGVSTAYRFSIPFQSTLIGSSVHRQSFVRQLPAPYSKDLSCSLVTIKAIPVDP